MRGVVSEELGFWEGESLIWASLRQKIEIRVSRRFSASRKCCGW